MKYQRFLKGSIVAVVLLLGITAAPQTAQGISYGHPDNGAHPNVGALIGRWPSLTPGAPDELYQICTGTLIAPDVVLTAAHCFFPSEEPKARYFTFDDSFETNEEGVIVTPDVTLYGGHQVVHPLFGQGGYNNPYDMAVFLLDEAVPGIAPAELAPEGFLNDKALTGERFTTVGYGISRDTNHQAWQSFIDSSDRRFANQTLTQRTKAWATFSMNLATGNGGTCYGDSGGPHFYGDLIVSITKGGDQPCKAADKTYRIDTPWAREFLGQYVAVP